MKRRHFLAAGAGAAAAAALARRARADESDVGLQTPTGTINGTLTVPSRLPAPIVLIVAGSGPTDRDGNNALGVTSNTYKLLAQALAARGVASLRYDKRGVAASFGAGLSEKDLRFQTYVDDAAGWLQTLHADTRFTGSVVAGHSEGSLIAILAAQKTPVSALVSLEGAGRKASVVLREQLKARYSPALYAQADAVIAKLERGEAVSDPPIMLASLFRESVQPYLISWFAIDPAAELAKVRRVPVTLVQGTADVQVTMADFAALAKAAPSAKRVVVPGMNHVLKYAPDASSAAAIERGYTDPALPVEPHAVDAVFAAAT